MDKRKPILEIGIIVLLILITAAIMNYPINIRGLEFWLFIIIALFETVLVIFITYIINKNRKRRKKIDKKYLESLEVQEFNNYEAPRNEFEEKLASLWQKYLNVKKV